MGATWEEARRCPMSGDPGKEVSRQMASRDSSFEPGSRIVTLECGNTRCEFYGQNWIVQVLPDGTIPEPTTSREKQFHALPGWRKERGRDIIQNLQDQLAREQKSGAEVDQFGRVIG